MSNWHRRNTGIYCRKRGTTYDVVFKRGSKWYIRVNADARLLGGDGGQKPFNTRLEATSALDDFVRHHSDEKPQAEAKQGREPHPDVECPKCGGSGIWYGHGHMENGVFRGPTGKCFACEGKGFQNDADQRRNWGYWNFHARIEV